PGQRGEAMSDSKKLSIDELWVRLRGFEGDEFETKSGKPFTYEINGAVLRPSRTDYNLSKAEFEKALALVPFDGPGAITQTIRGPAYVWAVLHDKRVRQRNW